MSTQTRFPTLYRVVTDLEAFSSLLLPERTLRSYQLAPARAILDSIASNRGDQFAVVFSRQAGKDELLAQLLSFLLLRQSRRGGTAIVAAPTLQPQATISRDRLRDRLRANPLTKPMLRMAGNSVRLGQALPLGVNRLPSAGLGFPRGAEENRPSIALPDCANRSRHGRSQQVVGRLAVQV